ncbi:kinase-like protein [Favolaschia claudopus]|uniref:Kinase-like protein n=1 Tax=Favolaschia claudopus TaxID=2862362 RepID=A0AAW0AF53_9AGAR
MLTHLLRHWNLDWEKDCDESLGPYDFTNSLDSNGFVIDSFHSEHISLRLHGNVAIQPHSTAGSLGQFFDIHDRIHGNNPKKILQGPNTLKLPAPAVYLEGLILVKEFEDKTGAVAPRFVYSEKENRKRKGSEAGRTMGSNVKRIRSQTNISAAPVPLRSEIGDLPGFSKISFVFASVSVDRDGTVNIEWPAPTATPTVCILQDTPVAQGKTKKVYKVICEGMPWVAKRFFEIGAGDEQVEIQQNADFLVQEATRLGKTGYYLGQFIAEAKRRNTSIDDTIAVTEFKLGLEVVADDSAPSPASGISLEAYLAADPSAVQVLWLFEPRRSSAVDHWSGTNEYPPWHQNKLGSTLNAFAHYVYQISQETTVIADVQTSKAVNEQGDGINVLFDMMLHTTNGASGVGDHGQNGIDTFVAKHECVRRCVGLRLDQEGFENALKGLEDGDSAAEDDD